MLPPSGIDWFRASTLAAMAVVGFLVGACREQSSSLRDAILSGELSNVRARLDAGDDPNALEREQTPLLTAVMCDNREAAKLLLERGGDPNRSMPTSYASVLHYLAAGGPIDGDASSYSHESTPSGLPKDVDWIRWLSRNTALDRDLIDGPTGTPLHVAAAKGLAPIVEVLLEIGARTDLRHGHPARTPLELAVSLDQRAVVDRLRSAERAPPGVRPGHSESTR